MLSSLRPCSVPAPPLTPAYTDTVRRAHIRTRNRELEGTLSKLDVQPHGPANEEEKAAIKRR